MFKKLSVRKLSKNLYVRLALLGTTTGLGGLGIYQALPSGDGPTTEVEANAEGPAEPNALVMLEDPAEQVPPSDSFRMPPPDEAIVRANNDGAPPTDPTASVGVYNTGSTQPAPIPAYGQPPVDAASAYGQAEPAAAQDIAAQDIASQPAPYGEGSYQPSSAPADLTVDPAAAGNSRYQPADPIPTPAAALAGAAVTEAAATQPDSGPLRAPPADVSTDNPYAAAPTPTPAATYPAVNQYQGAAPYANNAGPNMATPPGVGSSQNIVEEEPLTGAVEPSPLPAYNASNPPAVAQPTTPEYNVIDNGSPSRPIAVPEGSERYGQLPPEGIDQHAGQGIGTPGERTLEGPQSPNLRIEKVAPAEIQVGKQARFEIKVTNAGQATAHQVTVIDDLPRGVRFIDSAPPAERGPDGAFLWQLGALRSGEESTISLEVMPLEEGEIGSVATVSFQAQASVRTRCTRPQLALEHTAPKQVLIGQPVKLAISLSNPGTGAATGVVIQENVPAGLRHEAGSELEYEVGTLRPGESRQLELVLTADKPGLITHVVKAKGEGNLDVEHRVQLEVIAPQMQLAMSGPRKRYLDRQATYTVAASNPGTAPATDVEVVARLPRGMKFLAADNEGQYDATSHAVYWSLRELPAESAAQMQVTALPVEVGEQKLRVDGRAALGIENTVEHLVGVEGLAELFFTVTDAADPIEVGKETEYTVRVVNQGSKAAENVVATALLPQGLQAITGDGPTRATQEGSQIIFAPLARLAPKEEVTYKIRAKGMRAGDHLLTVQVVSGDSPAPVAKEESTRVYSDQ